MHLARIRYTLEHAGYQLDPLKIVEMLALREGEYGLVPDQTTGWMLDARRLRHECSRKGRRFNNIKNNVADVAWRFVRPVHRHAIRGRGSVPGEHRRSANEPRDAHEDSRSCSA